VTPRDRLTYAVLAIGVLVGLAVAVGQLLRAAGAVIR
jgi:hypothetical protein